MNSPRLLHGHVVSFPIISIGILRRHRDPALSELERQLGVHEVALHDLLLHAIHRDGQLNYRIAIRGCDKDSTLVSTKGIR
jgi:hypothetical protein